MIALPEKLTQAFNAHMVKSGVPAPLQCHFRKWLRFYVDFCHKYRHPYSDTASLQLFVQKLSDKGQPQKLRVQAQEAIGVYLQMLATKERKQNKTLSLPAMHKEEAPSGTGAQSHTGKDWRWVYAKLEEEIKVRHYSKKTLQSYRSWIRKFQTFAKSRDAHILTSTEVRDFLTYLAVEKEVSAASQNLAFNALLFLYRNVLGKDFGKVDGVVRAKQRKNIPVVLSREEISRIVGCLDLPYSLIVQLLYGCGLRLFECLKLRVHDLDFSTGMLRVHDGKGKKDRSIPIPVVLFEDLKEQIERVAELHQQDCVEKYDGVFLEGRLDVKYPHAAKEFPWQWVFPARALTLLPEEGELRRYHLHPAHVQKAIKKGVAKAVIPKRATAHTFRHSYASHLLQANYDIHTIQKLLGHSDVRTTMIYTQTVPSKTIKSAKSPLDF
jgi:integron integrase